MGNVAVNADLIVAIEENAGYLTRGVGSNLLFLGIESGAPLAGTRSLIDRSIFVRARGRLGRRIGFRLESARIEVVGSRYRNKGVSS